MLADLPVPAPAQWRHQAITDTPVLRNDLWEAMRSFARGIWTVGVYSGGTPMRLLHMQDYVVDDYGDLVALSPGAGVANSAWYASTYTIDPAACDWMAQFWQPLADGTPLRAMADTARVQRRHAPVRAEICEGATPFIAASVQLDDDETPNAPLYTLHATGQTGVLLLTHTQLCALALALLDIVRPAPQGALQ